VDDVLNDPALARRTTDFEDQLIHSPGTKLQLRTTDATTSSAGPQGPVGKPLRQTDLAVSVADRDLGLYRIRSCRLLPKGQLATGSQYSPKSLVRFPKSLAPDGLQAVEGGRTGHADRVHIVNGDALAFPVPGGGLRGRLDTARLEEHRR
jgi:hypothetical protein